MITLWLDIGVYPRLCFIGEGTELNVNILIPYGLDNKLLLQP